MDAATSKAPSLAELVLAGLSNGLLWLVDAPPVWLGPGLNKQCIVCRQRITPYQLQYDVPGPRGALPCHANCHSVWRHISSRIRNGPSTAHTA